MKEDALARIYITGHRNPDMDSIAAAVAYAALKNMTDSENCYVPAALGPLNSQSSRKFRLRNPLLQACFHKL